MLLSLLPVLFFAKPVNAVTSFEIPLSELKKPNNTATGYEIPLGELKRVTKTKPAKKKPEHHAKPAGAPPLKKPENRTPPTDPALWGTLESLRLVDEGVRIDFDDLREKFILLLEPLNKKIVLQFVGLSYPSGDTKLPLGKDGFVQARIGRHTDGTWVVLETADTVLPEFELRRDSKGITLKTTAPEHLADSEVLSGQVLLLTKEAVAAERRHTFTPDSFDTQADEDSQSEEDAADQPEEVQSLPDDEEDVTPLPSADTVTGRISHIPFSFAVADRQTTIQAVVSSNNEINEVYCVVQTIEGVKPVIILMTKAADASYTYEGKLPGQPANSQALRYTIVARDSLGNEIRSSEYKTPITPSPVVPGWQQ